MSKAKLSNNFRTNHADQQLQTIELQLQSDEYSEDADADADVEVEALDPAEADSAAFRLAAGSSESIPTRLQQVDHHQPNTTKDTAAIAISDAASEADSDEPPMQFSFKSLLIVYGVVVSDGIALNIINPFIADICSQRFGIPDDQIGLAAGWLVGSFSVAVFFSSFFLGHLSDIYGRKKLMLLGLLTGFVCTIMFGISRSFFFALFMRIIAGISNANVALTKTVISDVPSSVMSTEQRSLAFAYLSGCFQLARALAAAVAGVLTGIQIFGYDNDFFAPCLLGGLINAIFLVFCYWYMPETLKKKKPKTNISTHSATSSSAAQNPSNITSSSSSSSSSSKSTQNTVVPVSSPDTASDIDVLQSTNGGAHAKKKKQTRRYEKLVTDGGDDSGDTDATQESPSDLRIVIVAPKPRHSHSIASVMSPSADMTMSGGTPSPRPTPSPASSATPSDLHALQNGTRHGHAEEEEMSTTCSATCRHVFASLWFGLKVVWADILIRKINILSCMHAFGNGSFILLISLFGSLPIREGGLQFTPAHIGFTYFWFGMTCLFFQLFIYKHLHRRFGLFRLYLAGTLLLGASAAGLPFAGMIKHAEHSSAVNANTNGSGDADSIEPYSDLFLYKWSIAYYLLILAGLASGFMIALPVLSTCLSHAVQGSPYRGLTQGISQSLMSGVRGLGAMLCGSIFSQIALKTHLPGMVFWALAGINCVCFVVAKRFTTDERDRCTGHKENPPTAGPSPSPSPAPSSSSTSSPPLTQQVTLELTEYKQSHPPSASSSSTRREHSIAPPSSKYEQVDVDSDDAEEL